MQPTYIVKQLAAASANGIAHSQTPLAAGNLTLTSSTVTLDTQRRVLITGNGNDSAVTFTVYGAGDDGVAFSEDVAGGNATPYTVVTTQDFLTITRVAVSAATAGAVTVGTNGVGSSQWQIPNWHITPFNISLGCIVGTGTVNYTVQVTYQDVSRTYTDPNATFVTAFNHSTLASKTADLDGSITDPVAAYRITVNSGTDPVELVSIQAGIAG